jgi:hypothetical protein
MLASPPTSAATTLRDRMDLGTFLPVGWVPPSTRLSKTSWVRTGNTILVLERATPWMWGDWYLAVEDRTLPADWNGPSVSTLNNYASVARAFPIPARREHVSFAHHAELTSLPQKERDEWLDWCERPERPTVAELRAERKRRKTLLLPPEPPKAASIAASPAIHDALQGAPDEAPPVEKPPQPEEASSSADILPPKVLPAVEGPDDSTEADGISGEYRRFDDILLAIHLLGDQRHEASVAETLAAARRHPLYGPAWDDVFLRDLDRAIEFLTRLARQCK